MRYYAYENWTRYRARVHCEDCPYLTPARLQRARGGDIGANDRWHDLGDFATPRAGDDGSALPASDPTTTTRSRSADAVFLADGKRFLPIECQPLNHEDRRFDPHRHSNNDCHDRFHENHRVPSDNPMIEAIRLETVQRQTLICASSYY